MKIAIIGGIGSGKSTLSDLLKQLGKKVYNCDEIYNDILLDNAYIKEIDKNFDGVVKDNKIDKKALSRIVFSDSEKLKLLNSIAHPKVKEKLDEIINKEIDDIFVEVPVFIGSGLENYFDKVILITAEIKLRIKRIMLRNGCDKDYAKRVIISQASDEVLEQYADVIIQNNKDVLHLRQQLAKIL